MHEHATARRCCSARRGITEADHRAGRLFEVSGIRLVQRTKVSSFDPHLMFVWTAHSEKGHES